MSYEDVTDYESDNYEEITQEFIENYEEEWNEFVLEQYDASLQVDGDELYERWRDDKVIAEIEAKKEYQEE